VLEEVFVVRLLDEPDLLLNDVALVGVLNEVDEVVDELAPHISNPTLSRY